jgi:protein-S-isoprenylcysteine O-methyltransferase Ste14
MTPQKKDYWLVGTQFFLFIIFFLPVSAHYSSPYVIKYSGLAAFFLGLIVVFASLFNLDKSLTAYPTPKVGGELITTGFYRLVRHPIYSGLIFAFLGFAIYRESWFKILVSLILALLFHFKTQYEEEKLTEKYSQYPDYKKKTGKFFPKLL